MEYVCITDGRKITSVLTGLIQVGGEAAIKPVDPEQVHVAKSLNWSISAITVPIPNMSPTVYVISVRQKLVRWKPTQRTRTFRVAT